MSQYTIKLKFIATILLCSIAGACTSLGPAKPNSPYQGPYPTSFNKISVKNPLLAQEIGKLPEIQDGISESEAAALDHFVRIYNNNTKLFDKAFQEMYQVGLPDVRKYCAPLQALYWLAEDGKIDELPTQIHNYSLKNLLNSSWNFKLRFELEALDLSEPEAQEIVDALNKDVIWYAKYQETARDVVKLCYERNPNDIPREYRELIENGNNYKLTKEKFDRNNLRWKDYNIVIDRLNAPELLNFYINKNIKYAHYVPSYHRSPRSVINEKYGDCDDLAYFGRAVLSKAGYDVFGRIVGESPSVHIGLGIKLEDGSYILAVNFRNMNIMTGPHKTMLELDEALGYGPGYRQRGPFHFDW
jgi:hypothetical protein